MIRVRNLSKSYGRAKAVDDISFDISAGEVIGFLGPNGAGKSTTMRMLTGVLGADAGTIEIDGRRIQDAPEDAKAKIGYLPENNPLYEDMSVLEYLDFVGEVRGLDKTLRAERVRRNVDLYSLREVAGKDIGELSKGYRQRVGLAQAALADPPIMILDEPTSGLDPNQIVEIRNLIREIGRKKTVILSTHNLAEVDAVCSRVLIIHQGRIVADDTPKSLERKAMGTVLHAAVKGGGGAVADELRRLSGVREVKRTADQDGWQMFEMGIETSATGTEAAERVFELAVAKGWKLGELRCAKVSLENVFAHLTRQ